MSTRIYRINYGQGQVSELISLKEARAGMTSWSVIERRDPDTGEWFRVSPITGRFLPTKAVKI